MQAFELYKSALRKAGGAGSRGGHVVGHTRSGKPIYEAHHSSYAGLHAHAARAGKTATAEQGAKILHSSHGSFSAADHHDAFRAHTGQAKGLSSHQERAPHYRAANAHQHAWLANARKKS